MQKWEYLLVEFHRCTGHDAEETGPISKKLSELGQERWRVISSELTGGTFLLEREKKD